MSRRSSKLSWPAIAIALVIIGCRQLTTQKPAPKTRNRPAGGTSRRPPRPQSADNSSNSTSGLSSNEGFLLLGNPSNAGRDPDNYLLEHEQYALSFNRSKGEANWVSWHTDASDLGSIDRGAFRPDPDLPADWRVTPADYKGSGFDRGHICPSGDRTSSREANDATFYMSNMLPQTAQLNQHIWADLENYLREQIRAGNEVYEIAGGVGTSGSIAEGKVNVPKACWKVAVILPEGSGDLARIDAKTRVLAVGIPNAKDERLQTGDWRAYLVPLSKIRSATGLDFLSAVPRPVETALEGKVDSGA